MGRYTNIANRSTLKGKQYKSTTKYPDIPLGLMIYMFTQMKEIDLIF